MRLLTLALSLLTACDDGVKTDDTAADNACLPIFDEIDRLYDDVGTLTECTGAGAAVAGSLMNLDGVTIDNEGETMSPCVAALCDENYAYVATNDLSFYDFVAITPNPLVESQLIYRIPIDPEPLDEDIDFDNVETQDACVDAYNAYVADPTGHTGREPSELCYFESGDAEGLTDPSTGDKGHKILCLNQVAMMIGGAPVFGPNEGHMPFAFGNPGYWYPTGAANDSYYEGMTTALDLCGFHTANVGHNHAANEACYELDDDNRWVNSYVDVYETWDFDGALEGECTSESGILGWSFDGYPIKGPCVCVSRDDSGACTAIKRARSSWSYAGLSAWSDHAEADTDTDHLLDLEGTTCTSSGDCCPDGTANCEYACSYETFIDAGTRGGTVVDKRCVLHDYSWCTHDFVDHSDESDGADFVPLDLCNGYEGPDGYAYYATMSFPFVQSCYHGQPSDSVGSVAL